MDLILKIGSAILLIGAALILPEVTFLGLDFPEMDGNGVAIIQIGLIVMALGMILKEVLETDKNKNGGYY